MSFPTRHRLPRHAGWIPVLVLLAALAPWLGAWHRVAHAVGDPAASTMAAAGVADEQGFGHAAGSVDCSLFQGALCADGPPAHPPALALPTQAPVAPALHATEAPALALGWRAPARGPPRG